MALASDRPTQPISLSFEDFLAQYGDDSRYELIDGELFDVEPTGSRVRAASPEAMEVAAVILLRRRYAIARKHPQTSEVLETSEV